MPRTVHLLEFTRVSKAERVDREAGVLYGLVILGPSSANGRDYPETTMRQAAPLYEGRPANANHVKGRAAEASVYDRLGVWANARVREGRLYGDFHYLKSHPLADRLVEAAERPELNTAFGFSHNAVGREKRAGGKTIIESIERVESVDLVADPATVKGLYESMSAETKPAPGKKTLRQVLEAAVYKPAVRKWLKEMDEGGYFDVPADDTPAGAKGPAPDDGAAEPSVSKQFFQGICDQLDQAMAGADPDLHQPKVLKAIQKAKDALAPFTDGTASGDDSGDDDEGDDEMDGKESKKTPGPTPGETALREEMAVRDLIEDAALKFASPEARKAFIKSLIPLSEAERKPLIEERKALARPLTEQRGPRSQAPGGAPAAAGAVPTGGEAVGKWLSS